MSTVLSSSNVHLLAKLGSKIPTKESYLYLGFVISLLRTCCVMKCHCFFQEGGFISSSEVFQTFTEKLFWEGEQKSKVNEQEEMVIQPTGLAWKAGLDTCFNCWNVVLQVDWVNRYEACHKLLTRLTPSDLVKLVDNMAFSEKAVDTLPIESRIIIVNRSLRFVLQQDAALKKKGVPDDEQSRSVF